MGARYSPSADIEVTCFSYEGIDAIIAALKVGEAVSKEDYEIKIKLVAAPLYVMTSQALDRQEGIALMTVALAKMEESIKAAGGDLVIKVAVRFYFILFFSRVPVFSRASVTPAPGRHRGGRKGARRSHGGGGPRPGHGGRRRRVGPVERNKDLSF